jgi:hypothetical protein
VLLTGEYPNATGITTNDLCDRALGTCMYCAADTAGVQGAFPLLGTTVGDDLLERDSASKVIGIANKDRAAILMAGKNPTAAVWVDSETGMFTTSSAYATPSWFESIRLRLGALMMHHGRARSPMEVAPFRIALQRLRMLR